MGVQQSTGESGRGEQIHGDTPKQTLGVLERVGGGMGGTRGSGAIHKHCLSRWMWVRRESSNRRGAVAKRG
jgi:hypothetical protein